MKIRFESSPNAHLPEYYEFAVVSFTPHVETKMAGKAKRNAATQEEASQEDGSGKKKRVDNEEKKDEEKKEEKEEQPDIIPPIKVSPQKKNVAKAAITTPTRAKTKNKTAVAIKVSPKQVTGTALNGFIVVCLGFMMDKHCVSKLYKKNTDKEKIEFLDVSKCVPWVMTQVLDKDGHVMTRQKTVRAIKGVAVLTKAVQTNEEIKTFVNETINPFTWNNHLDMKEDVDKGWGDEANLPLLSDAPTDDEVWEVETWDKALQLPDETFKIGDSVTGDVKEWLKEDKNNLCQLFQEGKVPIQKCCQRNFPPELLRKPDVVKCNQQISGK